MITMSPVGKGPSRTIWLVIAGLLALAVVVFLVLQSGGGGGSGGGGY